MNWVVRVLDGVISASLPLLQDIPELLTLADVQLLISRLESVQICEGNADFQSIVDKKFLKGEDLCFLNAEGEARSYIEDEFLKRASDSNIIRSSDCEKLVSFTAHGSSRCLPCSKERKILHSKHGKEKLMKDSDTHSPNVPNMTLSRESLLAKTSALAQTKKLLSQKIKRLQARIQSDITRQGVEVDENVSNFLVSTLPESSPFATDSPMHLLWQQQKKMAGLVSSKGMRWHPTIIRWCISLYLKSPGTYSSMRNSGFITLPDRTTLLRYCNFTEAHAGINPDVLEHFLLSVNAEEMDAKDKNLSMMFDEMKVKSGLVYNKHSGKIVGFTEMTDIGNEIERFERGMKDDEEDQMRGVATQVMAVMVRGLFSKYEYMIAYFPGQGFTSDQLYPLLWECIKAIELIGFQVRCLVSDGFSANRKFYKLHLHDDHSNLSPEGHVFWTWNRMDPSRRIYFICDVPHLMKTVRNNLENSHWNNCTRSLTVSQ